MVCTLDKVALEQRVTVYIWVEDHAKVVPCTMAPATFRNFKKFSEELRKSDRFGDITDEAILEIWTTAVEEVLARLHLNTFSA